MIGQQSVCNNDGMSPGLVFCSVSHTWHQQAHPPTASEQTPGPRQHAARQWQLRWAQLNCGVVCCCSAPPLHGFGYGPGQEGSLGPHFGGQPGLGRGVLDAVASGSGVRGGLDGRTYWGHVGLARALQKLAVFNLAHMECCTSCCMLRQCMLL